MSEPAYAEPDEQGHVHLRLPGVSSETFLIEGPDEYGHFMLIPVEPYESIPENVRRVVEDGKAHPERWIRNRSRGR